MTKCVLKTQTENMYPYHSTIFQPFYPNRPKHVGYLEKNPYWLSVVRGTACVQSNLR